MKNKENKEDKGLDEFRKDLGKKLRNYRMQTRKPLKEIAGELEIQLNFLGHMEQGNRPVPEHLIPKFLKCYGSYGLKESDFALKYSPEGKGTCLREILTRSGTRMAVIIGDLIWDEIIRDGVRVPDNQPGGTVWYASKAAIEEKFIPVPVTTLGTYEDEKDLINNLDFRIVTYLIERKPDRKKPLNTIQIKDGEKEPYNIPNDHVNTFDVSNLQKRVYTSGCGKGDVIYFSAYPLVRQIKDICEQNKIQTYIEDFVNALLPVDEKERPIIVFDLPLPSLDRSYFTPQNLKTIIGKIDIFTIELRAVLKLLDEKEFETTINNIDMYSKEKDSSENKKAIDELDEVINENIERITDSFLGSEEGKTLILRFGYGHVSRQRIIKRKKDGGYDKRGKAEKTGYPERLSGFDPSTLSTTFGITDRLTFQYLKKLLSESLPLV